MVPPPNLSSLYLEASFTLVIVFLCALLFYKFNEVYSLSNHTGLGLFRNIFLFLGFSFLVKFILIFLRFFFHMQFRGLFVFPLLLFFVSLLSTMSALFVLSSSTSKKSSFSFSDFNWLVFLVSLVVSSVVFVNRLNALFLLFQLLIIILSAALLFTQGSKKSKKLFLLSYLFLFVFWVLSGFADAFVRFSFVFGILLYVLSILCLVIIYYFVLRRVRGS